MIENGVQVTCDACKRKEFVGENEDRNVKLKDWHHSEIGDLCPSCDRAWDNYKSSFIEQMRKEHGESVV